MGSLDLVGYPSHAYPVTSFNSHNTHFIFVGFSQIRESRNPSDDSGALEASSPDQRPKGYVYGIASS